MMVAEIVVVHVRRRIQSAQRPIQRQRRIGELLGDALADLDLHHVAGSDVFLAARHCSEVGLLRELARLGAAQAGARVRRLDVARQPRSELAQALAPELECLGMARVDVDDQVGTAGQVVDHRQLFGEQQVDVGQAELVRPGRRGGV